MSQIDWTQIKDYDDYHDNHYLPYLQKRRPPGSLPPKPFSVSMVTRLIKSANLNKKMRTKGVKVVIPEVTIQGKLPEFKINNKKGTIGNLINLIDSYKESIERLNEVLYCLESE